MRSIASLSIVVLFSVAAIYGAGFIGIADATSGDNFAQGAGGRVHGLIYGFNVYDELIPVSWASVTAVRDGQTVDVAYSNDGFYEMYLPSGTFDLVVDSPGYFTETKTIIMGDGSDYALNFYMERNNQPIPEFATLAVQIVVLLSLFTTILVVRKRRSIRTQTSLP
jgi:hypothetical protein